MKIFHEENGKQVVYVHIQDIMYIHNELPMTPIPAVIVDRTFGRVAKAASIVVDEDTGMSSAVIAGRINDSNRFNFIRFDEEEAVRFFKEQDCIIDYGDYQQLTKDELELEARRMLTKAMKAAEKWNAMSEAERMEDWTLYYEYQNLNHKVESLSEVYTMQIGDWNMPF